ncbi:MAG: MBL fold metallo-hydrolase [Sphingomonadales bacterium]|nr:MBL fold metallo-hydrolase [Sphingomonadales bacterium]
MPLKASIIQVTPFVQNCTLLWDDATMVGAVVDPGGNVERITNEIDKQGVTVEKILLTHGHLDHAGGAAELAETLGVPIEGPHIEDKFWIDAIPEHGAAYGMPGGRSFTPDRWLAGGETVSFGDITLDVYHCPGHTPGHVVFHHPPSELALVGDVLFKGSIGRTDFPKGDHAALIRSIREELWPLGDETVFVSGHGPLSTFGDERRTNPFVADDRY